MRTIKVTSLEQLISHAGTIISNNQSDISRLDLSDMLPNNMGADYQRILSRFEGLVDSSANLSEPRDIRIAQSLSAVGMDYFKNLADIRGTLLAEQVAMSMAQGQEFGNVRFDVSEEVQQSLQTDRSRLMDEYGVLNREAYACVAAMKSVVNGVPFSMEDYYSYLLGEDELTEEIDLAETEPDMDEELEEQALSEIADRMSELSEDFDELTSAADFDDFTGERNYNSATFRINMRDAEGLNMDNYRQRLTFSASEEDKQWCVDSVNGMLRSLYGDEMYETMSRDGANMFSGIFVDGKPASMLYDEDKSYSSKCVSLMRDVLDGGHRLNISPLEKGEDNQYHLSETVCDVNVEPSLEAQEEFSLWKAILRFFGFHIRTRAEKLEESVKFSELENQEAVENIRSLGRQNQEYNASIQPIKEAYHEYDHLVANVEEYAFRANMNDPASVMSSAADYYEFVAPDSSSPYGLEQMQAIKTLNRLPTRGSLVTMYMLSEGVTIEQMLNPDEAAKARMKQLGKEFSDTMTMPESPLKRLQREHPEYTREQLITQLQSPELQAQYKSECNAQVERIAAMYDKINAGVVMLESQLPQVDVSDNRSIAAGYTRHALFETASCDVLQSLETPIMQRGVHKEKIQPIMDYSGTNQYKHSIRELAKDMTSTDLTESTLCESSLVYSTLASALISKQYCLDIGKGIAGSDLNHAMLNIQKFPLMSEIAAIAKQDPTVVTYAKDIISGRKPMPEGMISQQGTSFAQCYQQHKQRNAPTLQMNRGTQL